MPNEYYYHTSHVKVSKHTDIRSQLGNSICIDLCKSPDINYAFITFEDMIAVRRFETALEKVKARLLNGE